MKMYILPMTLWLFLVVVCTAAEPGPSVSPSVAGPPIVVYPSNWAEIVRRANRYEAAQRTEDEPTRLTRQKFSAIVANISLPAGTTFQDALDRFGDASDLNLYVDWPSLEQVGISRDLEVTLPTLRNITWRKVLNLLLAQAGASLAGAAQIDWAIDAGVLTISTRTELDTHVSLRVYDIGDFLVPRQVAPRGTGFQLSTAGVNAAAGTGAGPVSPFGQTASPSSVP